MIDNAGAKLLDALVYGVAVTLAATLLGAIFALSSGSLVPLKYALFLVGFLLFGLSSVQLWRDASPRRDDETATTVEGRERTPFESALARLAPSVEGRVPLTERFPPQVKLFVASLFVLGLSLALEFVFGVGVE